jgi:hypothetical protein
MAVMHPEKLPSYILDDPMLKGEVDTYEALKKIPDDFVVFYQCYASPDSSSKALIRPIDFVILHKKLGLLAMEVKGGKIRLGEETIIDQYYKGDWHHKDPYEQVSKAVIELIMNCKADGANYWIPENTCVVFPHTNRSAITNMPHQLPDGTLCAEDMATLPVQIKTLFSKPRKDFAFTDSEFLDMRRRLNQRISLTRRKTKYNKEKRSGEAQKQQPKIKAEIAETTMEEAFTRMGLAPLRKEESKVYNPPPPPPVSKEMSAHYLPYRSTTRNYTNQISHPQKRKKAYKNWRKTSGTIIMAAVTLAASTAAFWMLINFIRSYQ